MFTLSTSSVAVPANGNASVTLTSNTNLDAPDAHYTGYLMAQTATGTISTPFAIFKAAKSHRVTFHFLNRAG